MYGSGSAGESGENSSLASTGQLLLLSPLFFHQRYSDDILHGAGEEDGVCGGGDINKICDNDN